MNITSISEEIGLIEKKSLSADRQRLMAKKRHLRLLRSCGKYYC